MRRLEAEPIQRFNESEIEPPTVFDVQLATGEMLDYGKAMHNTPAITSGYDGYDSAQLVLQTDTDAAIWNDEEHFPVGRLNSNHGRNIEVLAANANIVDKFGNEYHSLGIKGSDLSNPHLIQSATASRDYIIHGLQESLVMERVIRASSILRENGVGTEYILGLVLPRMFPVPAEDPEDRLVDASASITLPQLVENLAAGFVANQPAQKGKHPLEVKTELIDKFKDCDYLVSYRAMDTRHRFREFRTDEGFHAFKADVVRNSDDLNVHEHLKDLELISYMLYDFVPSLAGNVGRLHNADLAHGFLHPGNITAYGSVVDLDSVKGSPLNLGDEKISRTDIAKDVVGSLSSMLSVISYMELDPQHPMEQHRLRQDLSFYACVHFLEEYLSERFDDPDEKRKLLASLLPVAHSEDADFGFHQLSEYIGVAGNRIKPKVSVGTHDLPKLSQRQLRVARKDNFMSTLPSSYFESIKEKVFDPEWIFDDTEEEYPEGEEPFGHPLSVKLRTLTMGMVVENYPLKRYGSQRSADFLAALYSGLGEKVKGVENQDEINRQLGAYFDKQARRVFNEFCKPNTSDRVSRRISGTLRNVLPNYKTQLGFAYPNSKMKRLPILFSQSEQQYEDVIHGFNVTEDSNFEVLSYNEILDAIIGAQTLPDDTLILLDHDAANDSSNFLYVDNSIKALATHYAGSKPPIVMTNLGKNKTPVVHVPQTLFGRSGAGYEYADLENDFFTKESRPQSSLF